MWMSPSLLLETLSPFLSESNEPHSIFSNIQPDIQISFVVEVKIPIREDNPTRLYWIENNSPSIRSWLRGVPHVIIWGLSSSLDINNRSRNSIVSLPRATKHIRMWVLDSSWHRLTHRCLLIPTLEQGTWAIQSHNRFSQPLVAKRPSVSVVIWTSRKRNIRLEWLLEYYRWIHVPKLQGQV